MHASSENLVALYAPLWDLVKPTRNNNSRRDHTELEVVTSSAVDSNVERLTLLGLDPFADAITQLKESPYARNVQDLYGSILDSLSQPVDRSCPLKFRHLQPIKGKLAAASDDNNNNFSVEDCYEFVEVTVPFELVDQYLHQLEEETLDIIIRLSELCECFGILFNKDSKNYAGIVNLYRLFSILGCTIDQLKFSTNKVFLKFFEFDPEHVPLPTKPYFFGDQVWPRELQIRFNILNSVRNKSRAKNRQLMYTVFQGFKKGLLPVRPEKILTSLLDHANNLSTTRPLLSSRAVDCIVKTTRELFPRKGDNVVIPNTIDTSSYISSKSTIESNYSQHGSLGELLRRIGRDIPRNEDGSIGPGFCLSSEFFGYIRVREEVFEINTSFAHSTELYDLAHRESYRGLFETPLSQPCFILEPMKVRVITKPKWNQYLCMKDIQKQWWRRLKSSKYQFFDLIGRPVNTTDIETIANSMLSNKGWGICSGDYSAATDNLLMEVTLLILDYMLHTREVDHDFLRVRQMCRNALTGGKIQYDIGKFLPHGPWNDIVNQIQHMVSEKNSLSSVEGVWGNLLRNLRPVLGDAKLDIVKMVQDRRLQLKDTPADNFTVDQLNGQLMGSIISFILLCVANFSAYRYALETFFKREITLEEIAWEYPVRINGDDILFACSPEFYKHWKNCITEFGFTPSPGKNLFSDKYCQINSELYLIDRQSREGKLSDWSKAIHIPYINFGLITNRKKQDSEVDLVRHDVTWDNLNDSLYGRVKCVRKIQKTLLEGLEPKLQERANKLYIRHQRKWLDQFPGLNPFLAERSGGFGLDPIGIEDENWTELHKTYRRLFDIYLSVNGKETSRYLLGDSISRVDSLCKEHLATHFPEFRLIESEVSINPFGDSKEEPYYSPTNRYWRAIKAARRLQRANTHEFSKQYNSWECHQGTDSSSNQRPEPEVHLCGPTHKRVVRFEEAAISEQF